jgi:hypothetical protein
MIEVFENLLSDNHCDILINEMDVAIEENLTQTAKSKYGAMYYQEYVIPKTHGILHDIKDILLGVTQRYLSRYDPYQQVMEFDKFGEFVIRKYDTSDEDLPLKLRDIKLQSNNKILNYMFYLTDSDYPTIFKLYDSNVVNDNKKGSLCIHPPYWLFPHIIKVPKDSPKYIMFGHINW